MGPDLLHALPVASLAARITGCARVRDSRARRRLPHAKPAASEGYALEPPVNVYNVECGEFVGTPRLTVRSTEHIFTQGVTIQGLYLIAFRRVG